jgi:hypothetical protein
VFLVLPIASIMLAGALLAGCNPTYNWRDYTSQDGRFKALFPAKPSVFTRQVDVDGLRVAMTMTAAEVDGATFAVGTALAPNAARAQAVLPAMRRALLRNIGAVGHAAPATPDGVRVDATGAGKGRPVHLSGRFEARGARFYQVIVLSPAGKTPPEQIDQFLTAFAPF